MDMGGNDDLFDVGVYNNTSNAVLLVPCNALCGSLSASDTVTIEPGHTKSTGQDPDGVARPIEILSTSRAVLGCLPMQFSKTPAKGSTVDVSQMVPCGTTGGTQASGGHDWPYPQD